MDIKEKINSRLDKLLFVQNNNNKFELKSNVCCICDELLKYNEINYITQTLLEANKNICCKWKRIDDNIDTDIKQQLLSYYSYDGPFSTNWMSDKKEEYLISPRTCAIKKMKYHSQKYEEIEYMICSNCKSAVKNKTIPIKGINNFLLGGIPERFQDVTDIEWSYVSLLRTHAHFTQFKGGKNKKIKGFHTFLKLDIQKLCNATRLIDNFIKTDHVKVVLVGGFTKQQKEKVLKRLEINLQRVISLLKWLSINNSFYFSLEFPDIEKLPPPKIEIIDATNDDESENENVELTEDFKVVFPEGHTTEHNSGMDSIDSFLKLVHKLQSTGKSLEILSRSLDEVVPDYKDNNLLKAFPKIFPYGIGGPEDDRFDSKGMLSCNWDLEDYLDHVSKLSKPSIHESLFSLVIFNIYQTKNGLTSFFTK